MIFTLLLVALLAPQDAPEFYRPGNGVSLPRVQHQPGPQYTSDAMRRQVRGAVFLECVVDTNGMPTRIRVTKSLDPDLDREAVKALGSWRFLPGMKDGRAVPVLIQTEMTFSLSPSSSAPKTADTPVVVLSRSERDGTTTVYEVTPDRFWSIAAWNPRTAPQPPLSIGDAIAKAREWVNTAKPRAGGNGYNMLSAVLTRTAAATDRWCYEVNFVPIVAGDEYSSNVITAVVLFDGSMVEPHVRPKP